MKLRIGVVGVGRAWESRHLPALRALADRLEVRAVCDPVQHRAEYAARQVGAAVHDGYRVLIAREDVDAVMLLSAGYYGATPIHAACEYGKGVYCAAAIDLTDGEATDLRNRVEQSGIAFMAEFPCRWSPATLRLKELIATRLGQPKLLFLNRRRTVPKNHDRGDRCLRDLVELVDWCRYVTDSDPESLTATSHLCELGYHDYFSVSLDFAPAKQSAAQEQSPVRPMAVISCGDYISDGMKESLAYRRPADMKVVCENGIAFVDLPNTVAWFDDAGQHLETLDHERPVGEHLLITFQRAVESLVLMSSSLEDAHRAILIANHAKISCQTGQRVECR